MKLLYATSITLPSYRANRIQVVSMARAWTKLLGPDFTLGVGVADHSLASVNHAVMGVSLRSFRLAWRYVSYARRERVTHVYCREEKLLLCMILFNMFFFRMPLVFCYELHHLIYMNARWHALLLKRVAYTISITHGMRDALVRYGYPQERILVAPDAVDLSLFDVSVRKDEARARVGLSRDAKIIVYTGDIDEPWKGADTLYEASKAFGNEYLFLIVGSKPHHVDYFRSSHPDRSNFVLAGYKPHSEIPFVLKAADVAVLPNSNASELSRLSTSPMKLFEYMASGTPIVASDLPSIREILDESSATLVAPDDPHALAQGILQTFQDADKAAARAVRARSMIATRTWDTRAADIVQFIQ